MENQVQVPVYDIMNPMISHVPRGMEGKTILVYGGNRTGKTAVGAGLAKPFYLGFEDGINGISGIPFLPIQRWSDFIKHNKSLTDPFTLSAVRAKYQTIIFDTVETSALMCQDYVCQKYGAESIAKGNEGFGLWKEYEQEYFKQINLLTSCGYTVYFISHEGSRTFLNEESKPYDKLYPTGDKRSIDPVCNLVDIIGYARVNGIDPSTGKEIRSSLYLTNTPFYLAGSRFDYLTSKIEVFSAENLEKAIAEAVEEQEKHKKNSTVEFKEQKQEKVVTRETFDEMKRQVGEFAQQMSADPVLFQKYTEIVEENLGVGATASTTTKKQEQQIDLILSELRKLKLN